MKKVAIIGAGASGLMAACFAAKRASVTIFEKQKMPGRKILATGNGRCNISNRNLDSTFYYGKNPSFVRNIFGIFGLDETEQFFSSIGIPFTEGKDGKLFPASFQAASVQKMLAFEVQKRGVEILLHRRIDKVVPQKKGFLLITTGHQQHQFDAVILAAGSSAYPQLGGSDSGYALAASLGHSIEPVIPAIVPLNAIPKALHRLEGIKWNCTITAKCHNTTIAASTGEVLFTKYGLSGPATLDISTAVNRKIAAGKEVEIFIDFFPSMSRAQLISHFHTFFNETSKPLALCIAGMIKERIGEIVFTLAGKDPYSVAHSVQNEDILAFVDIFKQLRAIPGKPRSFSDAMVASGGISTDEISPSTMESQIQPGLYITGELLDITGTSGGYNLQFAWSTGAIAGMSV